HHNTVSAAYQDLEAAGHVELLRGSGVFVRRSVPRGLPEARGLDEMIRLALHAAFAKGVTGPEIRAAVQPWLAAAPPDRAVAGEPTPERAQLLAHEIRQSLDIPATGATLEEVARDPGVLSGALAVVLPYHEANLTRIAPGAALEVIHLEV